MGVYGHVKVKGRVGAKVMRFRNAAHMAAGDFGALGFSPLVEGLGRVWAKCRWMP